VEVPVTLLPLGGPLARREAEVSGMAWAGDTLLLLPQVPGLFRDEARGVPGAEGADGALFALSRGELEAAVQGRRAGPLLARPFPVHAPGLAALFAQPGVEGFEALAVRGEQVFLTLERKTPAGMVAHVLSGRLLPGGAGLALDAGRLGPPIPGASGLRNMSEEALVVAGERLLTVHEVNGAAHAPAPRVHVFGLDLSARGTLPFPAVDYRITDATPPDAEGRFWAMNYFWPGEKALAVVGEPLAARWGEGTSHALHGAVERLLPLQLTADGVRLREAPPLQLALREDRTARNWEALAPLEGFGLLLATDTYPETLLGFVPLPEEGAAGQAR
jgi:hypothetical protein